MSTPNTTIDHISDTATPSPAGGESPRRRPVLLWSLLAGFVLLQLGAWTAWLILASHHRVEEVPLATRHGH